MVKKGIFWYKGNDRGVVGISDNWELDDELEVATILARGRSIEADLKVGAAATAVATAINCGEVIILRTIYRSFLLSSWFKNVLIAASSGCVESTIFTVLSRIN